MTESEKKKIKRFGLTKLNAPKRTPGHPKKKGIVATRINGKVVIKRFGDQNMGHNYNSEARKSFKSRHRKNIAKGRSSSAYWADKFFWSKGGQKKRPPKTQKVIKGKRR